MDQRLVVAVDGWEADSAYPHGHYVRTLGRIGDKDTETVREGRSNLHRSACAGRGKGGPRQEEAGEKASNDGGVTGLCYVVMSKRPTASCATQSRHAAVVHMQCCRLG